MTISVFNKVENIVRKGENAGYQHFLLYPHCFPKASSFGIFKTQDRLVKDWTAMHNTAFLLFMVALQLASILQLFAMAALR